MNSETEIILWSMGSGFTITFGLMAFMWNNINKKFDKVDNRFDKLDEKVTDIDRRLCRLEGAFASKDCCMIKQDGFLKKVE